jgi:hypothetical protein
MRAIADAAHHDQDRGGILRCGLHERLDRAAHEVCALGVLAELVGQDLLAALALHGEGKAVLDRLGLGERATDLDVVGAVVGLHRLVAEGIEVGRRDAGAALYRMILEGGVARLGLVQSGHEHGLGFEQRRCGLRPRGGSQREKH